MTSSLMIRTATITDLPSIVRIYNRSIPDLNATCDEEPATLEERIPWFHSHDEKYPLWVAEADRRVAGWACISSYSDKSGYRLTVENSVYVDGDFRGRGVGKRLLAHTLSEAGRLGYHAVLARIFAHNPVSLGLHLRHGFEEMGRLREVALMAGQYRDVAFLVKLL